MDAYTNGAVLPFSWEKVLQNDAKVKWFVKTPLHYKPSMGVVSSRLWVPTVIHLILLPLYSLGYPASRGPSIFLDKSGRGRDSSWFI